MCEKDDRNVLMRLIICSKTVTLQLQVQIYLVKRRKCVDYSLKFDWNCYDHQNTSQVGWWGCTHCVVLIWILFATFIT